MRTHARIRRLLMHTDFRASIAQRISDERRTLAERWFLRLRSYLPVEDDQIFPSESRLDHIPELIRAISVYLGHPQDEAVSANTTIVEKARELGALRHEQQASLHQILREYHLLSGVLIAFVQEEIHTQQWTPPPAQVIAVVSSLYQVVGVLSQATVEAFVELYTRTIEIQNERLEEFTRLAAHEWRQPLQVLQFAVSVAMNQNVPPEVARKTLQSVERNIERLVALTHNLEAVARLQDVPNNALVQEMSTAVIAREAARQLREMAETQQVQIRIQDSLPTLRLDVGRLELIFVNLMSNAIKYSDPGKDVRSIDVRHDGHHDRWHHIVIEDNGIGIPAENLGSIFQRYTRAHSSREGLAHVGGLGLGLAIVQDCVRALGGEIDVRSEEGVGTTFVLKLPHTTPVA